jgi:anti-sigma regulatory factor (Ser/Thr protein kinase)
MNPEDPVGGRMQDALVEVEIPSRVDLVAVVRMVVAAASSAVEALHGDRLDDLRVVVSEATTNAIEANLLAGGTDGRVVVRCEAEPGVVRLRVRDEGHGMPDPLEIPAMGDPDRLSMEGGFGIPLMRQLSDRATFHTGPEGTVVSLELRQG